MTLVLSYRCEHHYHGPCVSPSCRCVCHIDGRYCRAGWCEHCAESINGKCHCPCHKKRI